MRKSFDSLCALVSAQMKRNFMSGDVFIFLNRDRNRIKLLVWDRSGFVIWYKRLEEGTFRWPQKEGACARYRREELLLLLGGIDLVQTRERKWYRREATWAEK